MMVSKGQGAIATVDAHASVVTVLPRWLCGKSENENEKADNVANGFNSQSPE
jgi:hypothetical protein